MWCIYSPSNPSSFLGFIPTPPCLSVWTNDTCVQFKLHVFLVLCSLREKWSTSLMKRREYLDEQIHSLIDKPGNCNVGTANSKMVLLSHFFRLLLLGRPLFPTWCFHVVTSCSPIVISDFLLLITSVLFSILVSLQTSQQAIKREKAGWLTSGFV